MTFYKITGFVDGGIHRHFEASLRKAKAYKRKTETGSEFHDLDIEKCQVGSGRTALIDCLNHLVFETGLNEH